MCKSVLKLFNKVFEWSHLKDQAWSQQWWVKTYISCVFSCFAESSPTNEWNNGILQPLNVICVYSLNHLHSDSAWIIPLERELKMLFKTTTEFLFLCFCYHFEKHFLLFLLVLMAHFFKKVFIIKCISIHINFIWSL